MFCKKAIYVNWGNIPSIEFEFGPVNLLSGGNGSGKTTAADGLQSLMTAAYENLFSYNPGQEESTQRSRAKHVRTLASYILGCDDGSYARTDTTDGYLAAVFHPTQGETAEPFTAVMGVRAYLDGTGHHKQARLDDVKFLIVPNEELSLSHFVKQNNNEKHVVPITHIADLLKKELGKQAVEVYDKKGPYLNRLYGALRGLTGARCAVPQREAKHAAKTFAHFMAYKPVKSINDFVAHEVLEPKDLNDDIKQVSELMKTIHDMEQDTRRLNQSIDALNTVSDYATYCINNWTDLVVSHYAEAMRQYLNVQNEHTQFKKEYATNQTLMDSTQQRMDSNTQKKNKLHQQQVDLEAKRQGIPVLKDKDEFEKEIEKNKTEISHLSVHLLTENNQIINNHQCVEQLKSKLKHSTIGLDVPLFDSREFKQSLNRLINMGSETGINAAKLNNSDWVGIADLESKLDGLIDIENSHSDVYASLHGHHQNSVRDQLSFLVGKRREEQNRVYQKIKNLTQEIHSLEHNKVAYPTDVQQALDAIKSQCPQAKPSVLCDYIEITDPKWQMAIEGYIGGNRYAIIVEPNFESEAIQIIRRMKGRRNTAKVIQGEKVHRDAERMRLAPHSIVELMRFEHKIVEYFIKATYGNVVQVADNETLRHTARGVMAQGMGSGGYAMFRCDMDEQNLVFGKTAREKALNAKRTNLEALIEDSKKIEQRHRDTDDVFNLIKQIKPIQCAHAVKKLLDLFQTVDDLETQLAHLDLSSYESLDQQLEAVKTAYREVDEELKTLSTALGQCKEKRNTLEKNIQALEHQEETSYVQREKTHQRVQEITQIYPEFNTEEALNRAEQTARQASASLQNDIEDYKNQLSKHHSELYVKILEYNDSANTHEQIYFDFQSGDIENERGFKIVVNTQKDINRIHNMLKNNVLVDRHGQLKNLKDDFNTAFVTNLCHSIYQSINEGKQVLENLNEELKHHRFGADQERFYFGYHWVPEFKEYQKFFKDVISLPNLGDGSTLFDVDLSEKSQEVRDHLLQMLLEKDEQTAQQELERISDYRNYRKYEIYKEPLNKAPIALSKYGTGSGGQLETPAYIIRSAAITSAFKFNEGKAHCRMVLVDEAFSKMDEVRSREVINYLTQTLGLQLIFIMPSSKSGPFMDLISHQIVFSKCPTTTPIGELKTRVIVDRKECNQNNIEQLWKNHRKSIRHQASLDFMEGIIDV